MAHNESFDRSVLINGMLDLGIDYQDIELPEKWECTMKIFKAKGYVPAKLDACCSRHGIALQHHDALSTYIFEKASEHLKHSEKTLDKFKDSNDILGLVHSPLFHSMIRAKSIQRLVKLLDGNFDDLKNFTQDYSR